MKMYVCGSMNGLGAGWIYLGLDRPNVILFGIGVAIFVGQYIVQLWPARYPQASEEANG